MRIDKVGTTGCKRLLVTPNGEESMGVSESAASLEVEEPKHSMRIRPHDPCRNAVDTGPSGVLPDFPTGSKLGDNQAKSIREEKKIKTVFWNANAWNAQNCEKVADVVKRANADVLCITDAEMDEGRTRYMHGYLNTLKRLTGKNWREDRTHASPPYKTLCRW